MCQRDIVQLDFPETLRKLLNGFTWLVSIA